MSSRPDANPAALWAVLSPVQQALLGAVAETAQHTGGDAYVVGGPVRDLLLGATHLHDLDLMTTTDARVVAAEFARRVDGEVEKTTTFGTATVTVPTADGITSLDFATTRTEMYSRPGALPITTFPAPTVHDDLRRRDFTINAMALPVISEAGEMPATFGPLVDPFDGLSDLQAGLIRVLHDTSFRDDPTRLFRGARYAARYRNIFEPQTAALAQSAIRERYISTISPARKRREIELGMREHDAIRCLAAFATLGILQATSPVLVWDEWVAARISLLIVQQSPQRGDIEEAIWPLWAAFVLRHGESATAAVQRLFTDLAITETAVQAPIRLLARAFDAWQAGTINADTRNSALAPYFEKMPEWIATVFFPSLAARLRALYDRLQAYDLASHVKGNTLRDDFGVSQGAGIGKLLAELRAAWLDENIETLEDEKGFVRDCLMD